MSQAPSRASRKGAVGGVVEVHGHGALAQVDGLEGPGDALAAEVAGRAPEVAALGLALDDEGAVISEEAGRERARPVLRDLDDDEAAQRALDGRGEGVEERRADRLADGVAGRVGRGIPRSVFDTEGGAREEVGPPPGSERLAAAEVGGVGEGAEGEDGGVGQARLLGETHHLVDGVAAEPGLGRLPDGGAVLATGFDGGPILDDVFATDEGAEAGPLAGDGLVGAHFAIGAGDDAEGVGDAAGWPHGRALHPHRESGNDGHDDVQRHLLDIDAGGRGALPGGEAEGLQEHSRSRRLGNNGRDVAGGGHEAAVRVVEGGVARADGAPRPGDGVLGRGDLHAGVTVSGQVAVVADADGEAAALLVGDAKRIEEAGQWSRDARLRPHGHGQGEGFERHGAIR